MLNKPCLSQYALFEEVDTKDIDRARQIYEACIKLIPHQEFTFAKVWTLYAEFELRQLNVDKARKLLGRAIGQCPKEKLFKDYITLELQLREFDRCRQLYQKYIEVGADHLFVRDSADYCPEILLVRSYERYRIHEVC